MISLVTQSQRLADLRASERAALRDEIMQAVRDETLGYLVERAAGDLAAEDEALALGVYANCADLVRADRVIDEEERRFMATLAERLGLAPGKRDLIDEVMDRKNRH